jgi:TatD DNase family protein
MKDFRVQFAVQIGTDVNNSRKAIELAKKYDVFFATVGLHPSDIMDITDLDKIRNEFEKLIVENRDYVV